METLTNIYFRGRDFGCFLLILLYISAVPSLINSNHVGIFNDLEKTDCRNDSYYAEGSVFESNLKRVLNALVQHASQTKFNTSVYGQGLDQIYGLLQCRGDTTVDQCYNCSRNATTTIRQSQECGNAVGGKIWFDFCFLRYENYSFFGQLYDVGYYHYSNNSNPDVFARALRLLTSLSAEVANASSWNRYASRTAAESFPTIYGLVQCTGDIPTADCTICLADAINDIKKDDYRQDGVQSVLGSCIVSYEIYRFFNPPSPAEPPSNTPVVASSSKQSNKIPTILGVVGGFLLLALLVCLFTIRRRFKRHQGHEQVEEDTLLGEDRQIVTFNLETLVAATENFNYDNKLGEGGFGPVYKGTTRDGKEIAVKKLSLNSMQGKKEFLTEINLVAKIQHRNLVKLLGCCAEGSERLLVYEYLPNSSLDKILFDPIKRKQLDWQQRYNIIMGVARGLLYLHEDSQPRIIHRDIKASNILLDERLSPKIADFGLAKLFPEDESFVSTSSKVAGTLGYMAPEYAMHGQLSAKADVYSFGVLLLELVTGRKNTDYNVSPDMQILLEWAWRSYEAGNSVEIIDPLVVFESCDEEQALGCIQVGLWCTQADSSLRPPMSTVIMMLSSHSVTLPELTKPVFANSVRPINPKYSASNSRLPHGSATTSSASSDPVPASSHAHASSIELVVPR